MPKRKEYLFKSCDICGEPNQIEEGRINRNSLELLEYSDGIHPQCWQLLFGDKTPGDFKNPKHAMANMILENNVRSHHLSRSKMFKEDFQIEKWIRKMYEDD